MIYSDASFIVSLFANEDKRTAAWRWWESNGLCQIIVSRLTLLEVENTFHAHHLDHKFTAPDLRHALTGLAQARMEGLLVRREAAVHRLYPEAHRLISHFSSKAAYGTLDILHVAAAMVFRAGTFLTFDKRQAALAITAGLHVEPKSQR
jgi:predicted nucleic acid-binding protein